MWVSGQAWNSLLKMSPRTETKPRRPAAAALFCATPPSIHRAVIEGGARRPRFGKFFFFGEGGRGGGGGGKFSCANPSSRNDLHRNFFLVFSNFPSRYLSLGGDEPLAHDWALGPNNFFLRAYRFVTSACVFTTEEVHLRSLDSSMNPIFRLSTGKPDTTGPSTVKTGAI